MTTLNISKTKTESPTEENCGSSFIRASVFATAKFGSAPNSERKALHPPDFNPFTKNDPVSDDEGKSNVKTRDAAESDNNGDVDKEQTDEDTLQPPSDKVKENENDSSTTTKEISELKVSYALSGSTDFVFGQNLSKKVVNADFTTQSNEAESTVNELRNMEFSTANVVARAPESSAKSLQESASVFMSKQCTKIPDKVEQRTGEEEERTVLKVSGSLFWYDKEDHGWIERGRVNLHLNDSTLVKTHSRLVARREGTHSLVLNTFLFSRMLVSLASKKALRISALDEDQKISIFLLKGSAENIGRLKLLLESRIEALKKLEEEKCNEEKPFSKNDMSCPSIPAKTDSDNISIPLNKDNVDTSRKRSAEHCDAAKSFPDEKKRVKSDGD